MSIWVKCACTRGRTSPIAFSIRSITSSADRTRSSRLPNWNFCWVIDSPDSRSRQ
ncbi:hypothetical protein [Kribbella qitaiheensis]|uniref:hypothetical protein n=1 Tax=Kribbella qitaiheensis TaxID=1544730 RepID=UPI001FEAD8E4|nr:hypothetical protein [Kribbella qitaiheensis]